MKLSDDAIDADKLADFGDEAVRLLVAREFRALADRFGYAMATGRDPAVAIEADLARCLAEPERPDFGDDDAPKVGYFQANDSGLVALVECVARFGDAPVLVGLVVTTRDDDRFLILEDIS